MTDEIGFHHEIHQALPGGEDASGKKHAYLGMYREEYREMVIKDVSFIVIARNESFALRKCLGSITSMSLKECEVICVDSDSTDNTLDVMKSYVGNIYNLTIVQCSGYVNAPVARNAGMRYATKRYIFFVDGDVELHPDFIYVALETIELGNAEAVTGCLDEIVYFDGYEQIKKPMSHRKYYPRVMEIRHDCGGIVLVTSQLAKMVGPWDELMDINEDLDYVLRLSRYGQFLALPVLMGVHHTLIYNERLQQYFKKRFPMHFGRLIRKNLDRPMIVLSLINRNRGFLAGFVVYGLFLAGILLTGFLSLPFLYTALVISFMVISDLFWGAIKKKNTLNRFLTHYLYVPMIIAGIFFDANRNRTATTVERIC